MPLEKTTLDWANESRQIQVQIYPNIKVYSVETPELVYCSRQNVDAEKKKILEVDIPNLGYDYRYEVVGFSLVVWGALSFLKDETKTAT